MSAYLIHNFDSPSSQYFGAGINTPLMQAIWWYYVPESNSESWFWGLCFYSSFWVYLSFMSLIRSSRLVLARALMMEFKKRRKDQYHIDKTKETGEEDHWPHTRRGGESRPSGRCHWPHPRLCYLSGKVQKNYKLLIQLISWLRNDWFPTKWTKYLVLVGKSHAWTIHSEIYLLIPLKMTTSLF